MIPHYGKMRYPFCFLIFSTQIEIYLFKINSNSKNKNYFETSYNIIFICTIGSDITKNTPYRIILFIILSVRT